jgi:hypothetical protein
VGPDFYETRSQSPHATRLQKIETSFSNKIRTRLSFTAQKARRVRQSTFDSQAYKNERVTSAQQQQIVSEPRFVNCTCIPFSEKK